MVNRDFETLAEERLNLPPAPAEEPPPAPEENIFKDELLDIDPVRLVQITNDFCERITECRADMGLQFGNPEPEAYSWAWYRRVARSSYAGNFEHRASLGGVFAITGANLSLNIPARFIRLLAAKHADDLVGTEPFFAAMPADIDEADEADLTKQVEKKAQKEIARSNLKTVLEESIRVSLTEGERPIKLAWVVDETEFRGPATVAVSQLMATPDGATVGGEPLRTPKGQYVFQKDDFLMVLADDQGAFKGRYEPGTEAPAGLHVETRLKKEPAFIITPAMLGTDGKLTYQAFPDLLQTISHKNQLEAYGLQCEDFIYPIMLPTLGHADVMCHCYDEALATVEANFQLADKDEKYARAMTLVKETAAQAGRSQPILEAGEFSRGGHPTRKVMNLHEGYYRVRVNPEDKRESWIFLVVDFATRMPLDAAYLGAMKMKKPPFILLRGLESWPGRPYGVGVYQKMGSANTAIDFWFNRAALKCSKEASADFMHEDAFLEAQDAQAFKMGGLTKYRLRSDKDYSPTNPPIFRVNLNELSEKEFELIERLVQSQVLQFGITSASDDDASGKHATGNTATGVRNIERTGNLVQRATENMMAADITGLMEQAVDIVLENMDEVEMEFSNGGDILSTLNRDEIRLLPRQVRMTLTKARSAESLETNQQADAFADKYYALPKWQQKIRRSFYIEILRSLQVADADEKLKDPTDAEIEAEAQAMANPVPPAPSESFNLALKDILTAPPKVQAQLFAKIGITVTEAELTVMRARSDAKEAEEKAAEQPPYPKK